MHQEALDFKQSLKDNTQKRNPFNAKINKESLDKARRKGHQQMADSQNYAASHIQEVDQEYDEGAFDMLADEGAGGDIDSKLEEENN